MGELLIAILIFAVAPGILILTGVVGDSKLAGLISQLISAVRAGTGSRAGFGQPDLRVLNCRVELTEHGRNSCGANAFTIEICGSIHAPRDTNHAGAHISITDMTEGIERAQPVRSQVKQWQEQGSAAFIYNADLGKLPYTDSTIWDWMQIARIEVGWLIFPRRGKRNLLFSVSIFSGESSEKIAGAKCTVNYDNTAVGYDDLPENIERARALAVPLAFAVSASDNKLYDCEVELIKKWARANIDVCQTSREAKRKLEKALDKTVGFFRDGNQLDTFKICKAIAEITPVGERYDILELCMRVAQANGTVSAEEATLLKKLADWLEVDSNKFHSMMDEILPAGMHEVEDVEAILGVTSDMDKEQTRKHLNKEYRKWNARVTSADPKIQSQADYMLKFIAEVRHEYVSQGISIIDP